MNSAAFALPTPSSTVWSTIVALAAGRGDHHVGVGEDVHVAGDAGIVEGKAGGIGADLAASSPSAAGRRPSESASKSSGTIGWMG
jgi:hypothetical protein